MHTVGTRKSLASRLGEEQGVALIIALLSMLLLTALGMALSLTTTTERRIASNYRDGVETIYAADAGVERVMQDVLTVPDWNRILDGTATSSFVDGAPGVRTLPDGSKLDLAQATAMVRCGKTTCSDADIEAATDERPWAKNNPRWQLYAYGPVSELVPTATVNSNVYVVVWIGDDPSENDDLPLVDGDESGSSGKCGTPCENPGRGVVALLAHAYGPGGVQRVLEATLARTDTTEIERGYTGQRGQDEQNRRARKAAVQTPGKALTRTQLAL
jgi:PilX N-terminal